MKPIENRYHFSLIFSVNGANPNGDPLVENRPRTTINGEGRITSVCLKRKIRNRLQDMGENIFVQSDDRNDDGNESLIERAKTVEEYLNNNGKKTTIKEKKAITEAVCKKWIDTRAFGQVFAFNGSELSLGIRGPMTIGDAISVCPITINDTQIIKSTTGSNDGKRSDTMGLMYTVDYSLYVVHGSINPHLAQKTGLTEEDVEQIKHALLTLFENDESAARPVGSMNVVKLIWWEQKPDKKEDGLATGRYGPAACFGALHVTPKTETPACLSDYDISVDEFPGLTPTIYNFI